MLSCISDAFSLILIRQHECNAANNADSVARLRNAVGRRDEQTDDPGWLATVAYRLDTARHYVGICGYKTTVKLDSFERSAGGDHKR